MAVVAVTNGLEAWKILEDATNHIDLVLTEVVTPCLSGVGLLSKIKRHKVSKHIPVISKSCFYSLLEFQSREQHVPLIFQRANTF